MAVYTLPDADPGVTIVGPFIFTDGRADFAGEVGPNLQRLIEIYGIQEGEPDDTDAPSGAEVAAGVTPAPATLDSDAGASSDSSTSRSSGPAQANLYQPAQQPSTPEQAAAQPTETVSTGSSTDGSESVDSASATGH